MTFYKKISRDININGKKRKDLPLNAEIFSYDEQVAKFVLTLINDIDKLYLSGAEVLAIMEYTVDGVGGSVEAISGIESVNENSIYFIVPEKLRGFEGSVTAGVYVNLSSGEKIDIQNLKFKMSRSLVDSTSGPAADFYFESFDDVLVKVKVAGDKAITDINSEAQRVSAHADQKISEYDAKFTQSDQKMSQLQNSQTALDSKLTETQQKITDADVYTKAESSANVVYQIIGKEKVQLTFAMDYKGKQSGSVAENVNVARHNAIVSLPSPENFGGNELSNVYYELLGSLDNRNFSTTQTIQGRLSGNLYLFNMVAHIENKLGDTFFSSLGAQTILQKARLLKDMFVSIESSNYGYGSSPSGYKMNTFRAANDLNGVFNSWILASNHANGTITKGSAKLVSQGQFDTALDKNGNFAMAVTAEASDGAVSSTLNVDYAILEFTIELSMNQFIKSMIAQYHIQNVQPQITDLAARVLALETKLNQ